tara:strand:+ start:333 stop:1073 length:741 start_codon:yes stop_codon:yes gene_type:complete
MKKTLSIFFICILLIGCQEKKDLKKYYPILHGKISSGEYKNFDPENYIYIDRSKVDNFKLFMIYNNIDTIFHFYDLSTPEKIFIVDTLKFEITKEKVKCLNNKFLFQDGYGRTDEYSSTFTYVESPSNIKVYDGENIKIIIKQNEKVLESYTIDLKHSKEYYQHIINPLSKSKFELSYIQYGGTYKVFDDKVKTYSNNFFKIEGSKIDFFLTPPTDEITYNEINIGSSSYDPCQYGCKKSVLRRVR